MTDGVSNGYLVICSGIRAVSNKFQKPQPKPKKSQ